MVNFLTFSLSQKNFLAALCPLKEPTFVLFELFQQKALSRGGPLTHVSCSFLLNSDYFFASKPPPPPTSPLSLRRKDSLASEMLRTLENLNLATLSSLSPSPIFPLLLDRLAHSFMQVLNIEYVIFIKSFDPFSHIGPPFYPIKLSSVRSLIPTTGRAFQQVDPSNPQTSPPRSRIPFSSRSCGLPPSPPFFCFCRPLLDTFPETLDLPLRPPGVLETRVFPFLVVR